MLYIIILHIRYTYRPTYDTATTMFRVGESPVSPVSSLRYTTVFQQLPSAAAAGVENYREVRTILVSIVGLLNNIAASCSPHWLLGTFFIVSVFSLVIIIVKNIKYRRWN